MNEGGRTPARPIALLLCALCLGLVPAEERGITIFMIGDSTMADKPLADNPERGWGQMLPRFFGPGVTVENHARNGRSTRSFLAEDRWQPVLAKIRPGDCVIIQFGHNDQSREKVDRYTPPEDYRANLVRFVTDTREREGIPILCTSIVRRRFNEAGEFYDVHGEYPGIVREVAAALDVHLIDMHRMSEALLRSLGAENSKRLFLWIPPGVYSSLPDGKKDDTHFSELGAVRMAELAVRGIRDLKPGLERHLRGSYRNPVIHSDYSDPDVVRMGSEYYMVASSFQCVPGIPVLHSRDLVHWTLIAHAVRHLPAPDFNISRHGEGIWAPCIRWHNGEFWIYFGDPDRGLYLVKSRDPHGPWDDPVLVHSAKGWIDPCLFRDDDGSAYLVHAWAKSRVGFNGVLTVHRLSRDGLSVLDSGTTVFRGGDRHPTIEGPKLYKRDGTYYIFAPAGGVTNGWQTVLRAKNVLGPYADTTVLAQGSTAVNGPHQGAMVETSEGSSWFLHFQDAGAYGRIVHLQPLWWTAGWPAVGADKDGDGVGEPMAGYVLPVADHTPQETELPGSDEFGAPELNLHWQWHANPSADRYSLSAHPGSLRLTAGSGGDPNLWTFPHLLLQKFPAEEFTATAAVTLAPGDGTVRAGLVVMGRDYATLAITAGPDGYALAHAVCADADRGGEERKISDVRLPGNRAHLRVAVEKGGVCRFSFSTDGTGYLPVGGEFRARKGVWIGAKVGLFALGGADGNGYADVDWFRISR